MRLKVILIIFFLFFTGSLSPVLAAPSGMLYFPEVMVSSLDNMIVVGSSEYVTVSFVNTAGTAISDVASTIQYLSLSAVNLDPTRVGIDVVASWAIFESASAVLPRVVGTAVADVDAGAIYAPFSIVTPVSMYTWRLGAPSASLPAYVDSSQFDSSLRVLRPGEVLNLTIRISCSAVGDSRIWFFFRATEDDFEGQPYPTSIDQIIDKSNVYYSKLPGPGQVAYWLPLHNSYDPYDVSLGSGHSFDQTSWVKRVTTTAFAKANKSVHQKPADEPPEERYAFHICGVKFLSSNVGEFYNPDIHPSMNGAMVWLLAKVEGGYVPANGVSSPYYGLFDIVEAHGNPVESGENGEALPGSFCFNLVNVRPGVYEFYLWLDEGNSGSGSGEQYEIYPAVPAELIVNSTLIGPIRLTAGEAEYCVGNNFGNVLVEAAFPVGGVVTPIYWEPKAFIFVALTAAAGFSLLYLFWKRIRARNSGTVANFINFDAGKP